MRAAIFVVLMLFLCGCAVKDKQSDFEKVKSDSTYKYVNSHSSRDHDSLVSDLGNLITLNTNRPKISPGESVDQYFADNAKTVETFNKKTEVTDKSHTDTESGKGEVNTVKVKDTTSKKVDSLIKTNMNTSWIIYIIIGIIILLVILALIWKFKIA